MLKNSLVAVCVAGLFALSASADMRISEWMYSGSGDEFVEFTNVGAAPVDMTGWSYDDSSQIPGALDLSAFGVVMPGESVVITEGTELLFRTDWSLPADVKVIGEYTNNIGRNDEINLYDAGAALVDRLTYGDEDFPGSIRTKDFSGNPATPAALGANDVYQWVLASPGDQFGSYTSASGDVGNPGIYIPEPASLSLLVIGGLLVTRRR